MSHYQMSVPKNMTLDQLKKIKADNFVAKNGFRARSSHPRN
jgi:hypothetical protein